MRSAVAIAILFGLAASGPADAQRRKKPPAETPSVAGSYAASFDEVANNCDATGMKLERATVQVTQDGRSIAIGIPKVPTMRGRLGRRGKLRAEVPPGANARGRFAISGRIDDEELHMVFIAEYYRGEKPLCTQSWNVTGRKK